jgi:peptide/nickel transport system substrate-binding protein
MELVRNKSAGMIVVVATLALLLTSCTATHPAENEKGSSTVTVAIVSDINSFDPAYPLGGGDQEVALNLYDRLVDFKYEEKPNGTLAWNGVEVKPSIASSWDIDGPTVTFHLRDDVKFSSGNVLTAEDVKWSYTRFSALGGNGQNQAVVGGLYKGDQVKVIDDHTVSITFTDPQGNPTMLPVSLLNLRFLQFGIIDSKTALEHATADDPYAGKWLAENVAGTGPYTVESRDPGQQIVLKSVTPRWTGTDPAYEKVILRVTGDADPVAMLKSGVVNYVSRGVSQRQFDGLATDGFSVFNEQVPVILKAEMTADIGPTSNPLVRQAIAYAIPYDEILKTVFFGRARPATTLLNPQDPYGTDAWAKYKTNLDMAQSLMKKANASSVDVKLWYNVDERALEDTALLIKQSLAKIGVSIELQPVPGLQYKSLRLERTDGTSEKMVGLSLDGLDGSIWIDDPDTVIQNWGVTKGNRNWAHFSNSRVDELQREFRSSTDVAARKKAYAEIQTTIADSAYILPLAVVGSTVAVSKGITGVAFGPDSYMRLEFLKPVK